MLELVVLIGNTVSRVEFFIPIALPYRVTYFFTSHYLPINLIISLLLCTITGPFSN